VYSYKKSFHRLESDPARNNIHQSGSLSMKGASKRMSWISPGP